MIVHCRDSKNDRQRANRQSFSGAVVLVAGPVCGAIDGPTLVDRSKGNAILLGMGCDIARLASLKEL